MIIVPPIEQFTDSYLVTTPGEVPIRFNNYINIIVEKSEVDGLRVDYRPVRENFTVNFVLSPPCFFLAAPALLHILYILEI